jgi:hypothetical protein
MRQKIMRIFFLGLIFSAAPAFSEAPEFRATIRGAIANIADAGMHISEATHLRLYPCATTGKMNVQMNKAGKLERAPGQDEQKFYLDGFQRLVPLSGLSSTGLPVFGDFHFFKVSGLKPGGCYKICVMMLDPPYAGMVPLTDENGKVVEVVIPEAESDDSATDPVVNLSKTPLFIPEPR